MHTGNSRQSVSSSRLELKDEATAVTPPIASQVEPRLILNVQDAKGNVLKMKLQLGVVKPEPLSTPSPD